MTYRGVVRGKTIEIETGLPYRDGEVVSVSVEPAVASLGCGSPADFLAAMHAEPHLRPEDVDALERSIAEGRLPVRESGIFDEEK
jgi:hypothetical protein